MSVVLYAEKALAAGKAESEWRGIAEWAEWNPDSWAQVFLGGSQFVERTQAQIEKKTWAIPKTSRAASIAKGEG
jgi:hypothetical protein